MPYDTIHIDAHPDDDRVARILLDRPDRHNVIDSQVLAELAEAVVAADRDAEVGGIVLGTTGEDFCAGASLEELSDLDIEDGIRWLTAYFETLDLLRETGKPVVAAVEGVCVAGGNELVMATDLAIAGESAHFGQPEVGVGSTAGGGGAQLLPLIVGEKRAKELLLTGDLLEAAEAERYGLINRVVTDGEADGAAQALLSRILDKKSPQAYRTIKSLLKPWSNIGLAHQEVARELTAHVWTSDEFRERSASFLDHDDFESRPFHGTRPMDRTT